MDTEKAFLELVYKEDVLRKTDMTLCERSKFRAYFKGKSTNRKPKKETMERHLKSYGFKKTPESWVI